MRIERKRWRLFDVPLPEIGFNLRLERVNELFLLSFRTNCPPLIFPICFPTILRIAFSFASPFFIFTYTADLRIDCSPLRRYLPGQFFIPSPPRALFSKKIIAYSHSFASRREYLRPLFCHSWNGSRLTNVFSFVAPRISFSSIGGILSFEFRADLLAKNFVTGGCRVHPSAIDIEDANRPPVETNEFEPNYCRRRLLLLILRLFCISEMSTDHRDLGN